MVSKLSLESVLTIERGPASEPKPLLHVKKLVLHGFDILLPATGKDSGSTGLKVNFSNGDTTSELHGLLTSMDL